MFDRRQILHATTEHATLSVGWRPANCSRSAKPPTRIGPSSRRSGSPSILQAPHPPTSEPVVLLCRFPPNVPPNRPLPSPVATGMVAWVRLTLAFACAFLSYWPSAPRFHPPGSPFGSLDSGLVQTATAEVQPKRSRTHKQKIDVLSCALVKNTRRQHRWPLESSLLDRPFASVISVPPRALFDLTLQ